MRDTEFTFTSMTSASVTLYTCDDDRYRPTRPSLWRSPHIGITGLQLGSPTTVVVTVTDDDDTRICHTWQQFDPVTNTCVNRPFLS